MSGKKLTGQVTIHDDTQREGDLENAKTALFEGFYEIQRDGNISKDKVDNMSPTDSFACPNGTFNKPMEKLTGIHPAVRIDFVTIKVATLKLQLVVRDAVVNLLQARVQAQTFAEAKGFRDIYSSRGSFRYQNFQ